MFPHASRLVLGKETLVTIAAYKVKMCHQYKVVLEKWLYINNNLANSEDISELKCIFEG